MPTRKTLGILALFVISSILSGCAAVGPYNGLNTSDAGATHKIGCFKYTDDVRTGPVLTPEDAAICEVQAINCQRQQNRQSSGFGETAVANAGVSAFLGGAQQKANVAIQHIVGTAAKRLPVAGNALGAIGSVNSSLIIKSQADDTTVGGCSRDFLTRYKKLHPGHDDLFIEVEMVRSNIQGNVIKQH